MAEIAQEFERIPPITRIYLSGALLTTGACALDLVSPFSLYLSFQPIFTKFQFWRLFTNFFFFGSRFSIDLLFHMFFLTRYCGSLESSSFQGRPADFLFMILFGATIMTIMAPILKLYFLGSSLTFMMVYIWSRRNPYAQMNFLGLLTFRAPYLPWVLLTFSMVLGGEGLVDILGIAIGHIYYYLEDVYPRMTNPSIRLLKTPQWFRLLVLQFGGDREDVIDLQDMAQEQAQNEQHPHAD